MNKLVKPGRIVFLFVIMAILVSIYGSALYTIQVSDRDTYLSGNDEYTTKITTVTAARGCIMDRNGVPLISNKIIYNVALSRLELVETGRPNEIILELLQTAKEHDVVYTDTFPITTTAPFDYQAAMTDTQKEYLSAYLDYFGLQPTISATDLIVWMKEHYGLDYTTGLNETRSIMGIRYELELRAIFNIKDYVFASDVNADFIALLLEQDFPGVSIVTSTEREYQTTCASHILGTIGLMNAEEYAYYKELDYPMDAYVGKSGVEQAFEEMLHGTDGVEKTTYNSDGAIVSVETLQEAKAGNNIYLTIDSEMQAVAETAVANIIAELNSEREPGQEMAEGGAAVVVDVNSGELLTSVSYPGFDLATYFEDYETLVSDPKLPLFNRATSGTYNPGSTFKMVPAFAGLYHGNISRWTSVEDVGKYTAYADFQPVCWVYPYGAHGMVDVVGALENSCNYFFYWLSDHMGIDVISDAASLFGLGEKTGIEIGEATGTVATPAYKRNELHEDWWAADTLMAAIGQGYNVFTPVQIANYVATIANGGTRYDLTLLKRVRDVTDSAVLYDAEPKVHTVIDDGQDGYIFDVLQEGMRAVAATGTASTELAGYPVPVAAKTGTVQSASSAMNNAVFVCYAPADDPEIAIAVVVEHGGSGSSIISAATDILDYYFRESSSDSGFVENTLRR